MRFNRRKRNFSYLFKFLLLPAVVFVAGLVIFFLQNNLFSIKKINIENKNAFCINNQEYVEKTGLYGKNLLYIDLKTEEDFSSYPCIKKIDFKKEYPSSLNLYLEGREPFGELISLKKEATVSSQILAEATSSANILDSGFIVDEEGVIFDKKNDPGLIKIYTHGVKIEIGKNIRMYKLSEVKKVLGEIGRFGIYADKLIFSGKDDLLIDSIPKVFLNMEKGLDYQLASLQLILNEAKMNEKEIEIIDLRFDKPIVKFNPKKK